MSERMAKDAVQERSYLVNRKAASLRQSVIESIRAAIAVGHYQPGQRFPERDLCALIGVSRTLVCEATPQLESAGLICAIPHRGTCAG
jgi:DNA-binding GntR family transcriptional regulator